MLILLQLWNLPQKTICLRISTEVSQEFNIALKEVYDLISSSNTVFLVYTPSWAFPCTAEASMILEDYIDLFCF